MTNKATFNRIKYVLVSAFLLVIIIPIFILSFFTNSKTQSEIYNNFIESTSQQVKHVDQYFVTYMSDLKQDAAYLAGEISLIGIDKSITNYFYLQDYDEQIIMMNPKENEGIESNIYSKLEAYGKTHPKVDSVYLATAHGGFIQWPIDFLPVPYDPRLRAWYHELKNEADYPLITSPYYTINDAITPVVSSGELIYDANENLQGIVAIDISLDTITSTIEELKIGESGYIILTDANGTILAYPYKSELNYKDISSLNIEQLRHIENVEDEHFELEMNDKPYFAKVHTSSVLGWKYISVIEKKELMQSVTDIRRAILVVASILATVLICITVMFSIKFSRPLISAAEQLDFLEKGDFTKEIPKDLMKDKGELNSFVQSVASMQQVIHELMNKIASMPDYSTDFTKYIDEISKQTNTVSKEAVDAIKVFAQSSQYEAKEKQLIENELQETTNNLIHIQKVGQIGQMDIDLKKQSIHLSNEAGFILDIFSDASISFDEFFKRVYEDDQEKVSKVIESKIGDVFTFEFRIYGHDDKMIWLYYSGKVLKNESDNQLVLKGFIQNITKRKQAVLKLHQINQNLKELVSDEIAKSRKKDAVIIYQSRLAKVGEMIGLIGHQWKQPLNNLNLILSNIKDDFKYGELDEQSLNTSIHKSRDMINQMSQTIDDFRHYFQPQREKEPFDISKTIDFALVLSEESIKKNQINIYSDLLDNVLVLGYSNEFCQVIYNIIYNGIDALVSYRANNRNICLNQEVIDHHVVLEISNNGGQIENEIMEHIFEPYFSTKKENEGTGIGLYMCKMIVEDHMHGDISCFNTDDGVSFVLRIPIVEREKNDD